MWSLQTVGTLCNIIVSKHYICNIEIILYKIQNLVNAIVKQRNMCVYIDSVMPWLATWMQIMLIKWLPWLAAWMQIMLTLTLLVVQYYYYLTIYINLHKFSLMSMHALVQLASIEVILCVSEHQLSTLKGPSYLYKTM